MLRCFWVARACCTLVRTAYRQKAQGLHNTPERLALAAPGARGVGAATIMANLLSTKGTDDAHYCSRTQVLIQILCQTSEPEDLLCLWSVSASVLRLVPKAVEWNRSAVSAGTITPSNINLIM